MTTHARKLMILVTMAFCFAWLMPGAWAGEKELSQKILIFQQDVPWSEIRAFSKSWEGFGATTVMDLPLINGIVLTVPGSITSSALASDPRVLRVEDDQELNLKGVLSGQKSDQKTYKSFITPVDQPEKFEYPWGILKLYGQPYHSVLGLACPQCGLARHSTCLVEHFKKENKGGHLRYGDRYANQERSKSGPGRNRYRRFV